MRRERGLARAGALLAALAIAAGAFGAHAADGAQAAEWLRTGALYALVHGAAVAAFAGTQRRAALLLLVGAAVFAGTLWAMAFGAPRWLGVVTPVGGGLMIVGWLMVAARRGQGR